MKTILITVLSVCAALVVPVRAADVKTNWESNCAQCHGKDGKAETKMGKMLSAKDLTDPKVQTEFTDAKAAEVIKNGVKENGKTTMKAFGGKLNDDEIKALVTYVRSLKK